MNKMHKSKRLKWGSLITICCLIGVALLSVNAKSLSKLPKAKVKKVANKSCDNIDYGKTTYATDIDPTNDGRNINIKASAKGDFYLVIASTDGDEELSYQVEEINNGKGNKKTRY